MKIFLCPAWQILIIRNIFPPWEQIKTFQIQQSFEKSLHSANCQRCVKATLTLLLIYFRGIIRVIMKIEMREIKFSWGVIAWDFLLIFYFIKIESKWLGKVSFRAKNQKDLLDDGNSFVMPLIFSKLFYEKENERILAIWAFLTFISGPSMA